MAEQQTPKQDDFFAFNAKYLIDPQSPSSELLNDASCFLETSRNLLRGDEDDQPSVSVIYAAIWLNEMAAGNIHAVQKREGLI